MSPTPSSASDLVEIEQIKRLKYKYLRCLDQKLWDEIAECFTPDATAAYSGGQYAFDDAEAIIAFLRQAMVHGYKERELLEDDAFDAVRGDRKFANLVADLRERLARR